MTTESKTALERMGLILSECEEEDWDEHSEYEAITRALRKELTAEQAKTHKDILIEAFERCKIPIQFMEGMHQDILSGFSIYFNKDGSYNRLFHWVKNT